MTHPTTSGTTAAYGSDIDVSSSTLEADESWADFLACVPGTHSYRWGWFHNGDGTVPEGDYAEISDIRIHVIDFKDEGVELETPEVKFDTTYVGYNRYTTAKTALLAKGFRVAGQTAANAFRTLCIRRRGSSWRLWKGSKKGV